MKKIVLQFKNLNKMALSSPVKLMLTL